MYLTHVFELGLVAIPEIFNEPCESPFLCEETEDMVRMCLALLVFDLPESLESRETNLGLGPGRLEVHGVRWNISEKKGIRFT